MFPLTGAKIAACWFCAFGSLCQNGYLLLWGPKACLAEMEPKKDAPPNKEEMALGHPSQLAREEWEETPSLLFKRQPLQPPHPNPPNPCNSPTRTHPTPATTPNPSPLPKPLPPPQTPPPTPTPNPSPHPLPKPLGADEFPQPPPQTPWSGSSRQDDDAVPVIPDLEEEAEEERLANPALKSQRTCRLPQNWLSFFVFLESSWLPPARQKMCVCFLLGSYFQPSRQVLYPRCGPRWVAASMVIYEESRLGDSTSFGPLSNPLLLYSCKQH